jgi:ATP-dependent helicase/nuclease subunit A
MMETGAPPVVQVHTDAIFRHSSAHVATSDASQVASIIRGLVDGIPVALKDTSSTSNHGDITLGENGNAALTYGDCMILVRYSKRMHIYAKALENAGIPYTMAGGKALKDVRLRGPFAGLSDRALYRYKEAGGLFTGTLDIPPGLSTDDPDAFEEAFATIREARRLLTAYPLSQALEVICSKRGLLASAALAEEGSAQAGALIRILSMLRGWEFEGMGWTELREELHRLLDGDVDADAMTLEAGSRNAVRLLNVHQAKGLEARIVFLADPAGSAGKRDAEVHVTRSEKGSRLFLPVRMRFKYSSRLLAEPPGWADAKKEEERFALAENTRLLYVAATRAKEQLYISRYLGKETGVWQPLHAVLDLENCPVARVVSAPVATITDGPSLDVLARTLVKTRTLLGNASLPSRKTVRASDMQKAQTMSEEPTLDWLGGRGKGYGRAVHRLFEAIVLNREQPELPIRARSLAEKLVLEEIDASEYRSSLDAAMAGVDGFLGSTIWEELMTANSVLTEVPFSLNCDGEDGDELLSGIIDLVYRSGDSWKIVDYKTDAGSETHLIHTYASQVKRYSDAWEALSGDAVSAYGLWWIPKMRWIPIT